MSCLSRLAFSLYSSLDSIEYIVHCIEEMTVKQRSVLIKCCQAQDVPLDHESDLPLYKIIREAPPLIESKRQVTSFFKFLQGIRDLLRSPVTSNVILDLARGLAMSQLQIEEEVWNSWGGEIRQCEGEPRPFAINWKPIFDPMHMQESVVPGIPPNPVMSMHFYRALYQWREEESRKLHYPRMTFKSMALGTKDDYSDSTGDVWGDERGMFTQIHWERIYCRTGFEAKGPCEIRQRWYKSGAKPRTYYAQGGDSYRVSRYLQDPFTSLVNTSEITHHVTRLQPTRIRLSFGQHGYIYDLIKFTSKMTEQRSFNREICAFVDGYPFTRVDARLGVITENFSDVLARYGEVAVEFPAVSYSRVFGRERMPYPSYHHQASMLGIFGNLMSCTFAHAAVVGQCVEDPSQLNVAGDDGFAAEGDNRDRFLDAINCLGEIETWKTFRSDERCSIALKRPVKQSGLLIEMGTMFSVIPIVTLAEFMEGYRDPRYRYQDDEFVSPVVKRNRIGMWLLRFLRSIHMGVSNLSEQDVEFAIQYASLVTDYCDMPHEGSVVQYGSDFFWPYIPSTDEIIREDPLRSLLVNCYSGCCRLPVTELDSMPQGIEYSRFAGHVWSDFSNPYTKYLEQLGFLESVPLYRYGVSLSDIDSLFEVFTFRPRQVYEYKILEDIPDHLVF